MGEDWERILIEVETENRNALGLYLSLGYRVVQTYGFYEVRL
jgi:ribosomal protein S18 acetylase RimI-like enzyme